MKRVLFYLLAGACVVAIAGCNESSAPTGPPATETPAATTSVPGQEPVAPVQKQLAPVGGPPRITFDRTSHDFGTIDETETDRTSFDFTNTGGSTLRIVDVTATCGCTTPRLEQRTFEPGEGGTIEVVFDPTGPGEQKKWINVLTNIEPRRVEKLQITADVTPFLILEPKMIGFGEVAYGEEHRVRVKVNCRDEEFDLLSVAVTHPAMTVQQVPVEPAEYGRVVAVVLDASAAWGGLYGRLTITIMGRVTADAPTTRYSRSARISGQVFGSLIAQPDTLRFGAAPGEAFERECVVEHRDGTPFDILEARLGEVPGLEGATIELQRVEPHRWRVVLSGTGERRRTVTEYVTLVTSVEGEEELRLRISGSVREPRPGS